MSPVFVLVIFLVFLAIASGLREGLIQQDNRQIEANLSNEARALTDNLEREFLVHTQAIGRMAYRLHAQPDMPESRWRMDARNYLEDFGVYQAIEWVDSNYIIRWLEPLAGNQDVVGYNVAFNDQRRKALDKAAATGEYDLSGIIDLRQGGKGMVIYYPVGAGDSNNGYIAGVFRMEVLAEQLLTSRVLEHFQIEIQDSGEPAYVLNADAEIARNFSVTVPVQFPTLDWTLTLRPNQSWVDGQRSSWPMLTFASLLFMGLLTSLTTLLVQLILKRNQALLKTRRELEREIDQRIAMQVDLERLESTDTLTGLANRRFFMEDLAHTLNIADRQMRQVGLVMIDLDRFQMLNDSLGHQFGDELLIKVSERLNSLSNERIRRRRVHDLPATRRRH
jgi:sensor domain CHASE-containing protein